MTLAEEATFKWNKYVKTIITEISKNYLCLSLAFSPPLISPAPILSHAYTHAHTFNVENTHASAGTPTHTHTHTYLLFHILNCMIHSSIHQAVFLLSWLERRQHQAVQPSSVQTESLVIPIQQGPLPLVQPLWHVHTAGLSGGEILWGYAAQGRYFWKKKKKKVANFCFYVFHNLKQKEAQAPVQNQQTRELISAWKASVFTQTQQQRPESPVPLVVFMYFLFTHMPGESHRRGLRFLSSCLCDIFWAFKLLCLLIWFLFLSPSGALLVLWHKRKWTDTHTHT